MHLQSKSKVMAFRQCPKRLWLSIHRPELSEESADAQVRFTVGFEVGDVARRLSDPKGSGMVLDARSAGYGAVFKKIRVAELAHLLSRMKRALAAIATRIMNLHPIARGYFNHPNQQSSWGIKSVLPAACSDLSYQSLEGIEDGRTAQKVFLEVLSPETSTNRKGKLRSQLTAAPWIPMPSYGYAGYFRAGHAEGIPTTNLCPLRLALSFSHSVFNFFPKASGLS